MHVRLVLQMFVPLVDLVNQLLFRIKDDVSLCVLTVVRPCVVTSVCLLFQVMQFIEKKRQNHRSVPTYSIAQELCCVIG